MKIFARPIDVIADFKENGDVNPIKFRVNRKDGSQVVVSIDRVIDKKFEKIAGCPTILFTCEASGKRCELKFWKGDCKWMLFKA